MILDARLRGVPKLPIALAFFSASFLCVPSDVFSPVRSAASAVMLWPRRAIAAVAESVAGEPTEMEALRSRVDELEQTVAKLSNEIAIRDRKIQDLSRLNQKPSLQRWGFLSAGIIATDASRWGGTVEVDAGSLDGVVEGSGVVSGEEIFGVVDEVHRWSCRVRIVTDTGFTAAGVLLERRMRGVVRGSGGRDCVMSYVVSDVEVPPGETVVTSGTDGVFPPGLTIGRVTDSTWYKQGLSINLRVQPACRPRLAANVVILRRPLKSVSAEERKRTERRNRRSR